MNPYEYAEQELHKQLIIDLAVWWLHAEEGYSLRRIADVLGISHSSAQRAMKRIDKHKKRAGTSHVPG